MTRSIFTALVIAALSGACTDVPSPAAPSTPTPAPRYTAFFTGTLAAQESQFYSFTATTAGTTEITLVGLRALDTPTPPVSMPLSLGIGTPAGTGCRLSTSLTAQPGLTAQLTAPTAATTYCVEIQDPGNLTNPLTFTVRIVHP